MSLSARRKAADNAASSLVLQRKQLSVPYTALHDVMHKWRPALLVGGGLVGGYLIGRRQAARLATGVLSLVTFGTTLMRSPLGALALSGIFGKIVRSARKEPKAESSGAGQRLPPS